MDVFDDTKRRMHTKEFQEQSVKLLTDKGYNVSIVIHRSSKESISSNFML
jgi:hypothetical protein